MKFFFRSKDKTRPTETAKQQKATYKVSMTGKDYSDMRRNDVALKVWLPESLEDQLGELTSYLDTSMSDLLRQILFQHLYGRYDLIGLVERQKFTPESSPYSGVRLSIAPLPLGSKPIPQPPPRKVAGVKVFIPERMRSDLHTLAEAKYQTLSEYVRLVIINHLFGALHSMGIQTTPPDNMEEGIVQF